MNAILRSLTFAVLSPSLLSACSVTVASQTEAPYYIGKQAHVIDTDYIDRYACANGKPLMCEGTGRLATSTVCRCP